jgi:hypothetical protein
MNPFQGSSQVLPDHIVAGHLQHKKREKRKNTSEQTVIGSVYFLGFFFDFFGNPFLLRSNQRPFGGNSLLNGLYRVDQV